MKKIILIICIIIVIIMLAIYGLSKYGTPEDTNEINSTSMDYSMSIDKNIQIVKGKNEFFTVASCINQYIYNLSNKDNKGILKLLDEGYKNKNNINENNVMQYVEDLNGYYIFKPEKMYYREKDENVSIYYVFGNILEDGIDDESAYSTNSREYYVTVSLDTKNMKYSVIPYGYICSGKIDETVKSKNLNVSVKEYTIYYDKSNIKLNISNASDNKFNSTDNIKLKYYNNEVTNVPEKEEIIIDKNENKEMRLEFKNEAMLPEKIVIDFEDEKIEIPIIKDVTEID